MIQVKEGGNALDEGLSGGRERNMVEHAPSRRRIGGSLLKSSDLENSDSTARRSDLEPLFRLLPGMGLGFQHQSAIQRRSYMRA